MNKKSAVADEMLRLREVEHLSNSEIAERLDLSSSYVFYLIGAGGIRRKRRVSKPVDEPVPVIKEKDIGEVGVAMIEAEKQLVKCENCIHFKSVTDIYCPRCSRNIYLGDFFQNKYVKTNQRL